VASAAAVTNVYTGALVEGAGVTHLRYRVVRTAASAG
jgi:hypothetical protein